MRQPKVHLVGGLPITAVVALYLLATGRWGSYVSLPGVAVYIGDIGVMLAILEVGVAIARRRTSLRHLTQSPLLMLLVATLLVYAAVRLALGPQHSLVALRDAAPYGYAVVAVLAFLLPAHNAGYVRLVAYVFLALHLAWTAVLHLLPGYPWHLPVLGTDAMIFVLRPDFDATVLGVGAAFALHDALVRRRSASTRELVALGTFAALSAVTMFGISTRAGLLAGSAAVAVAVAGGLRARGSERHEPVSGRPVGRLLLIACGIGLALVASLTPAGSRLLAGFGVGSDSQGAGGTINARLDVWTRVTDYVMSQPERTAVGVGFGRDFIVESGAAAALEGTYQNVRSPHDYLIGTMARLGVGGGLLAGVIIIVGWWAAWCALRRQASGPATSLAALVAIAIPIASLLGVILESPFGAIPYFWALGQLAAQSRPSPPQEPGPTSAVTPVERCAAV